MSGDGAALVDGVVVLGVGAAACAWAGDLPRMTGVVAAAYALRLAGWALLPPAERPLPWRLEIPFLVGCAALGGFNDWNTVVRHGVYQYGVPSELGALSIPCWMLAYWGLILRLVATLGAWPRLSRVDGAEAPREGPPGLARVAVLLGVVVGTRQCIYRLWGDPWLSWLPFAAALGLHAALRPWRARERRLALAAGVLGPLAEAALIQIGGLHRYALGWLGGVPLWIMLWWVLATLIWAELAGGALARVSDRRGAGAAPPLTAAQAG